MNLELPSNSRILILILNLLYMVVHLTNRMYKSIELPKPGHMFPGFLTSFWSTLPPSSHCSFQAQPSSPKLSCILGNLPQLCVFLSLRSVKSFQRHRLFIVKTTVEYNFFHFATSSVFSYETGNRPCFVLNMNIL